MSNRKKYNSRSLNRLDARKNRILQDAILAIWPSLDGVYPSPQSLVPKVLARDEITFKVNPNNISGALRALGLEKPRKPKPEPKPVGYTPSEQQLKANIDELRIWCDEVVAKANAAAAGLHIRIRRLESLVVSLCDQVASDNIHLVHLQRELGKDGFDAAPLCRSFLGAINQDTSNLACLRGLPGAHQDTRLWFPDPEPAPVCTEEAHARVYGGAP